MWPKKHSYKLTGFWTRESLLCTWQLIDPNDLIFVPGFAEAEITFMNLWGGAWEVEGIAQAL